MYLTAVQETNSYS